MAAICYKEMKRQKNALSLIVVNHNGGTERSLESLGATAIEEQPLSLEDALTAYVGRQGNRNLISDMEALRAHLGITQWVLCGGSWGSALSLAYGQAHPERCLGFILRGIFLGTRPEFTKLWQNMGDFYPEVFKEYSEHVSPSEREDLAQAYYRRLMNDDPMVYMAAARAFYHYDMMCATLSDKSHLSGPLDLNRVLALSRLFAHYSVNEFFLDSDQLIKNINRINHLPLHIVHGRYDIICRVSSAFKLHQLWPESKLTIVPDAGHASFEPGITRALLDAIKQMSERLIRS